jgi:uncharacterized protein YciI
LDPPTANDEDVDETSGGGGDQAEVAPRPNNALVIQEFCSKQQAESFRRQNRGINWYSKIKDRRRTMTQGEKKEEINLLRMKRAAEAETEKILRAERLHEPFKQKEADEKVAMAMYNEHYKAEYEKKDRSDVGAPATVITQLDKDFPEEASSNFKNIVDWEKVGEITQLQYLPAVWRPGTKPRGKTDIKRGKGKRGMGPVRREHFVGLVVDPLTRAFRKNGIEPKVG